MRILEMFGEPVADGGQESFVINVLTHMDRTDMHFDLLTPYFVNSRHYVRECRKMGVGIYSLGLEFAPGKSRGNTRKPLELFLRKHHYDVVHIHSGSISVLAIGAWAARKSGAKKVIVHSHCSVEKIGLKRRLLIALAGMSLKRNAHVYCACSEKAGKAKFTGSVVSSKLRVIKNGVDPDRFGFVPQKRKDVREKLGIPESAVVLGHTGRFSYQKNHDFLIDVFDCFHRKKTESFLLLIGEGELKNNIIRRVQNLGLEKSVIFTGSVSCVEDYLQAMDVFLFPSRFEGLGIAAVEAQASGLPVIASEAVPGDAGITENTVFLSTDSPEKWAEKAAEFAKLPRRDNREIIRKKGFDIMSTSKEIKDLYNG